MGTWTGSISSGNGGKYPCYHCERSCKVCVNADVANERFLQFLETLQPPQEIVDLQMAMMDADSYKRLKAHTTEQIDRLIIQINDLEVSDTAFEKYARYGMSLLKDLTWYFQEAEPQAKKMLLGSIFPAKLFFKDGNYRTTVLNPALALILQKIKGL